MDAVRTSSPISEAMSRHNSRVASSSSTIRIEKPVALLLSAGGLGFDIHGTSSTTKQEVGQKDLSELLTGEPFRPGNCGVVYTEKGIMSINNRTEVEASPRGS